MNERFIKKLTSTIRCSVCEEHYQVNSIKVLGHQDNVWFLNASCPACHSQTLVAATFNEGKSIEAVTDLTKAELANFAKASAISTDDILDLHGFFQDFDGDFAKLFSQK